MSYNNDRDQSNWGNNQGGQQRGRRVEAAPGAKLFVANLSWHTEADQLYEVFGRFGEVLDAVVLKDRETGRSRGFGFVTFGTADEANSALSLDGQDHDGRMMKVNIAEERRR